VDVTGLGDDTKLPFQVRLLTEASKQNFKFKNVYQGASNNTNFNSKCQVFGVENNVFRNSFHSPIMGLQDYMYKDKKDAIQSKKFHSNTSGFSIDEIMKR